MIVLDSSFLVAFHNERDVHHAAASRAMDRLVGGEWGSALLLEYVFLEVTTVVRMRRDLPTAIRVGDRLLRARELEFVPCAELFPEAFETFRAETDAALSFVDAAIVAAARRHAPGFVASFDTDFDGLAGVTRVA